MQPQLTDRMLGRITLTEDGAGFAVEAEPHVMARLKRLFPRINKGQIGRITLKATSETARDLEWFTERYPMDLEPAAAEQLARLARQYDQNQRELAEFLRADYRPPTFALAMPPRPYQAHAAAMLLKRRFLLLCDDLGLGKTCTAIATLTEPTALPAIVVTYTHLQRQWAREVRKFAPALRPHIVRSGSPYELDQVLLDGADRRERGSPDVLIITYHKLGGWADTLAKWGRSITFDEIQELRHSGSIKYLAAVGIAATMEYRLGLTATPIYNYGGEMYAILDVLSHGCLGDWTEFYREWCEGFHDKARIREPRVFGNYLRESGIMLRRTRADVQRELPPVMKIVHEIDADQKALDDVEDAAHELARRLLAPVEIRRGDRMNAAEQLSNVLRQATGLAKAPHVADFVRLLVEGGERVVLVGWHRAVYALWQSRLHGLRVGLYTGTESSSAKDTVAKQFIAGELDVLILSLRSGAGLDGLQGACRTMVFGELDWSPGVHAQCIGRLNRDGQTDPVTAYFLVSTVGADPVMADVLGLKTSQAEGIVSPKGPLVEEQRVDDGAIRRLAEGYVKAKPRRKSA